MDKVRAFPAGEFICEECGRNGFFSLIGTDVPNDAVESMKKEVRKEMSLPEEVEMIGEFMMHPDKVQCEHCGAEFEIEFD